MSPFIREYAPLVPFDPVQSTWIDVASGPLATEEDARNLREKIGHLPFGVNTPHQDWPFPFEKMAILLPIYLKGEAYSKGSTTITLERLGDGLIFQWWTNADRERGSVIIRSSGSLEEDRRSYVSRKFIQAMVGKTEEDCAKLGAQIFGVVIEDFVALAVQGA